MAVMIDKFPWIDEMTRYFLQGLSTECYDNGKRFTNRTRLRMIDEFLKVVESDYTRIPAKGLFRLYGKAPLTADNGDLVIVSTHADFAPKTQECYCDFDDDTYVIGTLDNSITNAVALYVMTRAKCPDNVYFAFTGNGYGACAGARDLMNFVKSFNKRMRVIVLDITANGFYERAHVTIENNYMYSHFGEYIADRLMNNKFLNWLFIPNDIEKLPYYVPHTLIMDEEPNADESWVYGSEFRKNMVECLSFCLPTRPDVNDPNVYWALKCALYRYREALTDILVNMYKF